MSYYNTLPTGCTAFAMVRPLSQIKDPEILTLTYYTIIRQK